MGEYSKKSILSIEYEILKILSEAEKPLGAVYLSTVLSQKYVISQSTIGRKMLHMDYQGYTKKVKNTGRVITNKGKEFLERLEEKLVYEKMHKAFIESINPSTFEDLIDMLVARRGLERESCRLAAKNAKDEHIMQMELTLSEQKLKIVEYGQAGDQEDQQFHQWIAIASGNKIIQTTLNLLRKQNDLAMCLGTVRKMIGAGELYKEHINILECIKAKDCYGAELAIEAHINKIIKEFSNHLLKFAQKQ